MGLFHSGMNHWQRQWLSDRLHKKSHDSTPAAAYSAPAPALNPAPAQKPKPDPEIAKVLRLKPDPAKALAWLDRTASKDNPELVRVLLDAIPPDQLNNTPHRSSSALEQLMTRRSYNFTWSAQADTDRLKCIELFLAAGGRWNPPMESIAKARRNLLTHDPAYTASVLRLLVHTPNAAGTDGLLELTRSPALEKKLAAADPKLVRELRALRKSKASTNPAQPASRPKAGSTPADPQSGSPQPSSEPASPALPPDSRT